VEGSANSYYSKGGSFVPDHKKRGREKTEVFFPCWAEAQPLVNSWEHGARPKENLKGIKRAEKEFIYRSPHARQKKGESRGGVFFFRRGGTSLLQSGGGGSSAEIRTKKIDEEKKKGRDARPPKTPKFEGGRSANRARREKRPERQRTILGVERDDQPYSKRILSTPPAEGRSGSGRKKETLCGVSVPSY